MLKLNTDRGICMLFLTIILAGALLAATSAIPHRGNYVINGTLYGDPAYRVVNGMPFVFLKRSLADGECDIADVHKHICDPMQGNEPHEVDSAYIVADMVVWMGVAFVVVLATQKWWVKLLGIRDSAS
jgi:hypothetical protein